MQNNGTSFGMYQIVKVGDYIVAQNNGFFYATLQDDGRFYVYRGSPSANYGGLVVSPYPFSPEGPIWEEQPPELKPGQEYFAILRNDGQFCLYAGEIPDDSKTFLAGDPDYYCIPADATNADVGKDYLIYLNPDGALCVWVSDPKTNTATAICSDQGDPIVDIQDITKIDYDLAAAKIAKSNPMTLYRQTLKNDTAEKQSSSLSSSESVAETSGWSDALAVKVGVSTQVKSGIPFLAEGKVQVSIGVTNTYTWNGSTTTTKTWGWNTPVVVSPGHTVEGLVSVTVSTITVPYTMSGTIILKSGTKMPGQWHGVYTGTNSHDLTVTFTDTDPVNQDIKQEIVELKPI